MVRSRNAASCTGCRNQNAHFRDRIYLDDESADAEELSLSINAAKDGLAILDKRLIKIKAEEPTLDVALKTAWAVFEGEFEAIKRRIVGFHFGEALAAIEAISPGHARELKTTCSWCRKDDSQTIENPIYRLANDSYTVRRAKEINLASPESDSDYVVVAERGIKDLRTELESVDIARLPEREQLEEAPVSAPVVSMPRPRHVSVPARQSTDLHSGGGAFGNFAQAQREAAERNLADMREQKARGMLPPAVAAKVA